MSERELAEVSQLRHLTAREVATVQSWSSSTSWQPGGRHYGCGKYLLKAGDRTGIPVEMTLVEDEPALYD